MDKFEFEFETVAELPTFGGGGGGLTQRYDWSKFPEPKKGDYKKARIEDVKNSKTIRTSITRYTDKLREEGTKEEDLPVFRISTVKNEKTGETIGFDVYRVPNKLHPTMGKLPGAVAPPEVKKEETEAAAPEVPATGGKK